ncbi:MAG: peptidase M19 [Pedosphaera sp.]|nr:peptidase M19 [Pedosphaera sp.]
MKNLPLILDAHLDLAMNATEWNRDLRLPLPDIRRRETGLKDKPDRTRGLVCFPEMRRGRVGLCVATQIARHVKRSNKLPGWHSAEQAWAHTQGQLAWYREMEAAGELVQIRNAKELEKHLKLWNAPSQRSKSASRKPIGYILSLEGADSLVTLAHLERAFGYGLRAVGPAHYGPGTYAHGTADSGGLPRKGRELLREMERLGIILDVTHLCEESFWDALKFFKGHIWSSHTNCRVLADWNRQFTDEQFKALIERGAVLGVALDAIMMVSGWAHLRSRPKDFNLKLKKLVEHIDHICQLAGSARHVGIGTDLDGGFGMEQAPMDLKSIADLQKLGPLLAARGYKPADIEAIFSGNFLGFLRRAWK